ncbi:MAG: hypothetical protein ACYTEQ_00730, partial [Planctomycetota bacterium]
MPHIPPKNPNQTRNTKARIFDGVGGPLTQILKRTDDRGRDISITIANEVFDLNLGEQGSMILRPGMTKKSTTGETETINGIFQYTIGGKLQYGIVSGTGVDLISLPQFNAPDPLELPQETKPADWPSAVPWLGDTVNDYMTPDPSLPAEDQSCPNSYTIGDDGTTLSFTMFEGGALPSDDNWYFWVSGRWDVSLTGTFSTTAAWYSTATTGIWAYTTGVCTAHDVNQIAIRINGKDADGNDLAVGSYSDVLSVTWSDGTISEVTIQLNVVATTATVTKLYLKAGSTSGWAATLAAMEAAAWADSALSLNCVQRSKLNATNFLTGTGALMLDTSALNGASVSSITLSILSETGASEAARINVQTHTANTPP